MAPLRAAAAAILLAGTLAAAALLPGTAAAQDADTPLDRALQQVEALLTALRADPNADPKLVAKLEDISGNLKKAKEAAGSASPGTPGGGGIPGGDVPGGEGIFKFTLDTFLGGVDLKEEERKLAEEILREFVVDYNLAKTHEDDKSKAVVRDHSEKRIAKSFQPRDANRLKDNLDTVIKRWEWGGGRRGR